jgi:hypothetical protein
MINVKQSTAVMVDDEYKLPVSVQELSIKNWISSQCFLGSYCVAITMLRPCEMPGMTRFYISELINHIGFFKYLVLFFLCGFIICSCTVRIT